MPENIVPIDFDALKKPVEQILGPQVRLRTFKGIVARVLQILQDPASSARDLADIVRSDPVMATKILIVVNSPIYGLRTPVTDLTQAIALLGYDETRKIVFSVSMFDSINRDHLFVIQQVFRHSIYMATFAQIVATALGRLVPEAFTCGLLADLGLLLICQNNFDAFTMMTEKFKQSQGALGPLDTEEKVWEITHSKLGAYAARSWNLPDLMVDTILYHHDPPGGEAATDGAFLAKVVHVADHLATAMGAPYLPLTRTRDSKQAITYLGRPFLEPLGLGEELLAPLFPDLERGARNAEYFCSLMKNR